MSTFPSPKNTSDTNRNFEEAADLWLLRTRNPQADIALFDAVQRRQEPPPASVVPSNGFYPTPDISPGPSLASAVQLRKIRGEQTVDTWLLPFDRPSLLGRSGKNNSSLDIDLWPDMGISRRHALLWFDGESWCIEDLCSTNGTFIAEMNIRGQRAMRLVPGMIVRLGRTVLTLTACTPKAPGVMQERPGGIEVGTPALKVGRTS